MPALLFEGTGVFSLFVLRTDREPRRPRFPVDCTPQSPTSVDSVMITLLALASLASSPTYSSEPIPTHKARLIMTFPEHAIATPMRDDGI